MSTFYLVRHAQANWTRDEDRPLSARGRDDAGRIAAILQGYPIQAIFTSPYRRARQSIEPLAARLDLPVQVEPDLRERRLGDIATMDFFDAVEATWRDLAFAFPGGESNAAAQQRGVGVIERLRGLHLAGHIVLATHGNLMALLLQHFDPAVDYAFWRSLTMPDIYALSFSQEGWPKIERLWLESG